MTTEKIMTCVHEIRNSIANGLDPFYAADQCEKLIAALAADLRQESAKKSGNGTAYNAAKRILKLAKTYAQKSVHYAWIDNEGRQCICDGYRAVRLHDSFDLEPRPDDAGIPLDLEKIFNGNRDGTHQVALPKISDLEAYIKAERADYMAKTTSAERKKQRFSAIWQYDGICVNAEYLLDILQILTDVSAMVSSNKNAGIIFESECGDAILLPVRPKGDISDDERIKKCESYMKPATPVEIEPEPVKPSDNAAPDAVPVLEENAIYTPDEFAYLLSHVA